MQNAQFIVHNLDNTIASTSISDRMILEIYLIQVFILSGQVSGQGVPRQQPA